MRLASAVIAAIALSATPARAEVTTLAENGFAVTHKVTVAVAPDEAFAMVRTPAKWWSKEHSWTGNAENFYMDAQAGGCFCELIPNEATTDSGAPQRTLRGSVQHMQIIYTDPGKLLRLSGVLGPLQGEALSGAMTIAFEPVKGGTEIRFEYVLGGFMRMPFDKVAPAVDAVIGEQASRLAMALGPLVGEATASDAAPSASAPDDNVTRLVADLAPDEDVTDRDVTADDTADEKPAATKPSSKPPRTKPGTRPLTRRTSNESESDPDEGR